MLAAKSAYQNQHSFNSAKNCLATQVLFKKKTLKTTPMRPCRSRKTQKSMAHSNTTANDRVWQPLESRKMRFSSLFEAFCCGIVINAMGKVLQLVTPPMTWGDLNGLKSKSLLQISSNWCRAHKQNIDIHWQTVALTVSGGQHSLASNP